MYQEQCNCFCGCQEILVFDTKPRGEPECQRCQDGNCINEHYEKTHNLHHRTCTDVKTQIRHTMEVIIGGTRYRKELKDRR